MVSKCGLLTPGSENLISYAAGLYKESNNDSRAGFFKEHFCRPCVPHMIGVFDTVGSLGMLYSAFHFFDTTLNPEIPYAYHAVSLDERRPKFDVMLWDEANAAPDQTIEQVWFAGVHSDVGGGYARKGLSDISLKWMLDKARGAGLTIDTSGMDFQPDEHADSHRSLDLKYRLIGLITGHWPRGANPRRIPKDSHIHRSVNTRCSQRSDYNPELPPNHDFVD